MTPTPAVNRFANLYSLFQYAVAQKLKYPRIRLQLGTDTIVVKLAGSKSRYEGQLMVTNDAGYGSPNNRYFGRVDQAGAIQAGRDLTPAVESLLEEFAANPVEVAQRYGALTGNCMFCDKHLDDAVSVAVGYGPICAKKWNLPHSAAKQSRKSRKAASNPTQNFLHEAVDPAQEHQIDIEMGLTEEESFDTPRMLPQRIVGTRIPVVSAEVENIEEVL